MQAVQMINNSAAAVFGPLNVEPPVYGFGEAGDITGSKGKMREHTFYLQSSDPKLAQIGLSASGTSSGKIKRNGAELASIDDAAETVRNASNKETILKQLKEAGYTDAEVGEIRTKASGKVSTAAPKATTTGSVTTTPKPTPAKSTSAPVQTVTKPTTPESTFDPHDKTTRAAGPKPKIAPGVNMKTVRDFVSTYGQRRTPAERQKQLDLWKLALPEDIYEAILATIPK
jgi:hypothetical protein